MADTGNIQGLDEVIAKMKALPIELRNKGAKAAGRKGANVIRDAAKAGWKPIDRPETPNNISENVLVQFGSRHFHQTGDIMFRVGIRGGARSYGNTRENRRKDRVGKLYKTGGNTFYWRFLEFGTSRFHGLFIMQKAMAASVEPATDATVSELNRQIDRITEKGK